MTFARSQPYLLGPDVSHYQGAIDGADLARRGMGFLIYKVGQGVGFDDSYAARNRDQARGHGLVECRYFFLESDTRGSHPASGAAQADAFIHLTLSLGGADRCGHAVDVEMQAPGVGPSGRVAADFAARWYARMPRHPLGVYSGAWYWVDHIGNPVFRGGWCWSSDYITGSGDPRWLLQYGGSDRKGVTPGYWPRPWGHRRMYDLRQFTSSAACGGRSRVDCSVFPGTRAQLERLWLPSAARPGPVPPLRVVLELQGAWHVPKDRHWGAGTDAAGHAVRRNRHDRAEQEAVGTVVDGRWGPKSQAAYLATVRATQRALRRGRYYRGRIDGVWGPGTDAGFRAARHDHYGK